MPWLIRGLPAAALFCLWALPGWAQDRPPVAGLQGAIRIPFSLPEAGEASIAIYNRAGQVVRILAQQIPLPAGEHEIRWDGMDLFGNLLEPGEGYSARVISGPGLRAVYQFSIDNAARPPWLTRSTGEGDAMRAGGWLGDHSPPSTIVHLGNQLFIGSRVAEHGHALVATNLNGEKRWGRNGLEGWQGPSSLVTDGQAVWAMCQSRRLYRIDPLSYQQKRIFDLGRDTCQTMAAHAGRVYIVARNHEAQLSPFRRSLGAGQFNFTASQPTPPPGGAPEHQISRQARFSTTFTSGGHFQTGIEPIPEGTSAWFMPVWKEPVEIGTLVMGRVPGVEQAEFYVLRAGIAYEREKHFPRSTARDDALADLGPLATGLHPDWQLLARSSLPHAVNLISPQTPPVSTSAMYVRLLRAPGAGNANPAVRMCRIAPRRFTALDQPLRLTLPADAVVESTTARPSPRLAWRVRSAEPISELNPLRIMLELPKPERVDGISLFNAINPQIRFEAWVGQGEPLADADEQDWQPVGTYRAGSSKQNGYASASTHSNDVQVAFDQPVTTRALRLTYTAGSLSGRSGLARTPEDTLLVACEELALLRLIDTAPDVPTHRLLVVDGESGKVLSRSEHASVNIAELAIAPDARMYALREGRVEQIRVAGPSPADTAAGLHADGAELAFTPLIQGFQEPRALTVTGTHIALFDAKQHNLMVYDRQARPISTLGRGRAFEPGPWDPNLLGRVSSIVLTPDGHVWVTEDSYSPKRVACFTMDGRFVRELIGPPEYGGGGYLDPKLDRFYYRGMQFAVDFAGGTARLAAMNDRYGHPASPALDASSFGYTKIGRIIEHQGRRYAVADPRGQGGVVVCLLENDRWKPVAVMGQAPGSPFLLRKEHWRAHWLRQRLTSQSFIWTDRNGDGQFQVDEVELFADADLGQKSPFGAAYWSNRIAPDLTIWTPRLRLAPTRISEHGVPLYERSMIQTWDLSAALPIFAGSFTTAGPTSAKGSFGGATVVAADGSLVIEGQPWRVGPDLKPVGGPISLAPAQDYRPPIAGRIKDQPLGWVGQALTDGPLGEVGIMNGNNGRWSVVSFTHGLTFGEIFTGRDGSFSGVEPVRGTDVTHRKQDWETFFGHFLRAHDGNYYVVAGKGYHGISRVDGLHDYRVVEIPVAIPPASVALNQQIREQLVRRTQAAQQARRTERTLAIPPLNRRTSAFKLDGEVEDWGPVASFAALDDEGPVHEPRLRVAAAFDDKGLYLAWWGDAHLGNSGDDWERIFKTGFSLDFAYRADPRARGRELVKGDRRLFFGNVAGQWSAVLYDYVDPAIEEDDYHAFTSPVATTRVARIIRLRPDDFRFALRSDYDIERRTKLPAGRSDFTAEAFITWDALGLSPARNATLRCDFGIHSADPSGIRVDQRTYWSNPITDTVTDEALEAAIAPETFGTATIK